MKLVRVQAQTTLQGTSYLLYKESLCVGHALLAGNCITQFVIEPNWRRKGYGSYLLKELLRQNGGFEKGRPSEFFVPMPPAHSPQMAAALALAQKFGFVPSPGRENLVRRRVPDLSAVEFTHRFLQNSLPAGGFYIDATCGNGHDTLFLCELAGADGRVLAVDVQPAAVSATNQVISQHGYASRGQAVLANHRDLLTLAEPQSADCVLFNFGWLPGASHSIASGPSSTIPALESALQIIKPGGVLAAVLYSGKQIGHTEKEAVLAFFSSLPLTQYTVLECRFSNWAQTAPLPCFVLKKRS